jgi:hypothetical protein
MKEARIRVLTNEPDYSDYQDLEYDWSSSVYGDVKEIIPIQTSQNQKGSMLPCPTTSMLTCITTWLLEDPLLPSSTSSIKPQWIGT